jgi:hypothetical protein
MKAIIITMVFLVQIGISQPSLIWTKEYDSGFDDYAQGITIDYLGNSIVTGAIYNGIDFDCFTIKYNSSGDTLWTRQFDTGGSDIARGCAVDSIGCIYIIGSSRFDTLYDYILIKYDFSGNLVWVRRYQSVFDNFGEAVAVDLNQDVIVSGYSYNGNSYDYLTVKYTPTGDTLWSRRYDAGFNDLSRDVAVDMNNNIIVTGSSYSISDSSFTFLTMKYNSIGDSLWVKRYLSPYFAYDNYANAVAVDTNIIVVGSAAGRPVIIKYTPSGDTIWIFYFPTNLGHGVHEPQDVAVDSAGNIFVVFDYLDVGNEYDYLTAKISPSGDTIWTVIYIKYNDGRDAYPRGIALDFNNDFIVTGFEYDDTTFNYVTVKYSEQGAIAEQIRKSFFPQKFELKELYPNPFRNHINIIFQTPNAECPEIAICNIAGQVVKKFNHLTNRSEYKIVWDGTDNSGKQLPDGVYFIHLDTGYYCKSKKVIFLR